MIYLLGNCIYQTVGKIYDHSKITLCLRSSREPIDKMINSLLSRPKKNAMNLRQNSQYLWKILLMQTLTYFTSVAFLLLTCRRHSYETSQAVRRGGCIIRLQCIHCGILMLPLHWNPVKLCLQSINVPITRILLFVYMIRRRVRQ